MSYLWSEIYHRKRKGRPGYYYLYVECGKIGGSDERIKIYYISQSSAYEARDLLMLKTGIVKE